MSREGTAHLVELDSFDGSSRSFVPVTEILVLQYHLQSNSIILINYTGCGENYRIEREKFYIGPGLEPGTLALLASVLTTTLSRTSADPS